MPSNVYPLGDSLPINATFANAAGAPTNPTAVFFEYTTPDGEETLLTFGIDPELTRTSTGHYTCTLPLGMAGPWYYRWYTTGTLVTALNGAFDVIAYKPA